MPTKEELLTFSRWQALRILRDEDHSDIEAFRLHLAGTGADANDPKRYGWPTPYSVYITTDPLLAGLPKND